MKNSWKIYAERGSMMVEALAMLGLITMVTPVLYKKAAERTTELQDINTASQMRTISKALDDYISDNYADLSAGDLGAVAIDKNDIVPYLPYGFDINNSKMFDEFQFAIRNELIDAGTPKEHSAITGTILAKSDSGVPMMRAAKIASMIGANGGVVNNNIVQGVQGGWGGEVSDFFGEGANVANGSLAVSSVHAVTSASGGGEALDHVLYRDNSHGVEGNTMVTNLIMGGNDIERVNQLIADADQRIALVTGGGTVVTDGNLAVEADAAVTGSISADSGTITNLLEAGSAQIAGELKAAGEALNVTSANITMTTTATTQIASPTVNVTGATTITSNGGAVIAATDNNVGISAGNNGNIKFNTNDLVIDSAGSHLVTVNDGKKQDGGLLVRGGVAEADSSDTGAFALAVDGSAYVVNNARIGGNLYLGGSLDADKLYGRTELGGGKLSDGTYNFVAGKDSVDIAKDNFTVGKWIEISGSTAKFGKQDADGNVTSGLRISRSSEVTKLIGPGATLQMYSGALLSSSGSFQAKIGDRSSDLYSELSVATGGAYLRVKKGGDRRALSATESGTTLIGTKGSAETSTAPTLALASGRATITADKMLVSSDNLKLNEDNLVFDRNAVFPADTSVRSSGVRINREGIIDLPRGTKPTSDSTVGKLKTSGYIRADRLVANQAFEEVSANMVHYNGEGGADVASKPYDAYQVNPAYTSVMHDIKLTTRGGARLSDILPDFINKGIYVLDNTYEEKGEDWTKYSVAEGTGGNPPQITDPPAECGSLNCVASPWLGFVPTPQCPPGYSKVITINPIRWKMAQAYAISQADNSIGNIFTGVGDKRGLDLNKYNAYFTTPLDPRPDAARFKLANSNGNGEHTHAVASGIPLTFQVNTWLNTTVYGVRKGGGDTSGTANHNARFNDFLGWHAIMGFLYYGSDYKDWLIAATGSADAYSDKVIWNLFPVLTQEMAAIANVYCYFERRNMTNPDWGWKQNLVDGGAVGYNQLTNFRSGYLKNNSSYRERLNDPALGYDEVW